MELTLIRRIFTPKATTGELFIDGKRECFTVEDHYPTPYVKTPRVTAIPVGVYTVAMHVPSPKYKGKLMPRLFNVSTPDGRLLVCSADRKVTFEGVLIHTGNTADDSEGCIIVGAKLGVNRVDDSVIAFGKLYPKLVAAHARGEKITLTISNQ